MYVPNERTLMDMKRMNKNIHKTFYFLNPNNNDEYKTVYMSFNPFANKIVPMISRFWVTGTPPDNMEELNPRLMSSINTMQNTSGYFF